MKRRIGLFLVFTLVIAMFYSDSVFAADNRVLKTIRYIEILEKELSNNGTSVELELDKALQYYQNLLLDRSSNLQDKNKILMPLSSIAGVGVETAKLVESAYKKYGDVLFDKTRKELEELKIEKDGKNVKAFGKKFLDGYFGVQE